MLKTIKNFVSSIGKRGKALICAAVATVNSCAMAAVASASDASVSTPDTASIMADAGNQLTTQFSSMVSTMIPVIIGILSSGLVIYGIFALIKVAKKIFAKVAG